MKINIAIDGPSAAGKSTIARKLAEKMHYVHLDTGAMYRCTGMKAKKTGIDLEDEKALCAMLQKTQILLTPEGKVFLDGEDVTSLIRTDEISLAASAVSKHPEVRKDLVARQQQMAKAGGFIMDGRDIGTVVLPNAEVKVYLTASSLVRAKRRALELEAKGEAVDLAKIEADIIDRDNRDMTREISPLKQAVDATLIDSSYMNIDEVVEAILNLVK